MAPRKRSKRAPLGRPPGASREATSARILAAARSCFARTGYAATTNKQIADEAGVTPAAIYLYYESKTALYVATVTDAYAELVRQFRAATEERLSAREGLRAVLAISAEVHERDPSLAAFFAALPLEMRRHDELAQPVAEGGAEVVSIFRELVQRGVRAKEIAPEQAPQVLSLFVACVIGFSNFAATIDSSQVGGIIDAFSALIDGTLFRRGARGRKEARR